MMCCCPNGPLISCSWLIVVFGDQEEAASDESMHQSLTITITQAVKQQGFLRFPVIRLAPETRQCNNSVILVLLTKINTPQYGEPSAQGLTSDSFCLLPCVSSQLPRLDSRCEHPRNGASCRVLSLRWSRHHWDGHWSPSWSAGAQR